MKLSGVSSSVSVLCILTVQASQFRFRMTLALLSLKQTAADWTNLAAFVKFAILRGNISVFKQNVWHEIKSYVKKCRQEMKKRLLKTRNVCYYIKKLLTKMIKNNIFKTTGLIYDEICFHLFILD